MTIQIQGLTPQQIEMCEALWQLEGEEDIMRYLSILSPEQRLEARAMMHLMLAEYIDTLDLGDCAQAREVCERIRQL
jgi:hypothetical protein